MSLSIVYFDTLLLHTIVYLLLSHAKNLPKSSHSLRVLSPNSIIADPKNNVTLVSQFTSICFMLRVYNAKPI